MFASESARTASWSLFPECHTSHVSTAANTSTPMYAMNSQKWRFAALSMTQAEELEGWIAIAGIASIVVVALVVIREAHHRRR